MGEPLPAASPDLLRRFSATPLVGNLPVMGRTIRLETNSAKVLAQACRATQGYAAPASTQPEFLWRIVCEPDAGGATAWPEMTAFYEGNLSFVNVGRRGFLAVDLTAREAVGFLPESLVAEETGFIRPFLAMLFSMSARALRLIPLSAACVGRAGNGLLILGRAESGKTACSYLAATPGLEFHADQAVFLEAGREELRAWGEFWPAVLHEDAQQFLPELAQRARCFAYQGRTLLYVGKPGGSRALESTIPVGCVLLERNSGREARLSSLDRAEFKARLEKSLLFQDGGSLPASASPAWRGLENLPAYRMSYGSDSSAAAVLIRDLLNDRRAEESGS